MPSGLTLAAPKIINWAQWTLVFVLLLAISLLLRYLMLRWLARWGRDKDSLAAIFISIVRGPSLLWCVTAAMALTINASDLEGSAARWLSGASVTFLVLSVCIATSMLLVRSANIHALKRGMSFGLSGVSRALVHVFVMLLGLMVLLRYFNLNITPILTALGVGGLAVALALRDTLANFFAGIHILAEAPINIGDFIRLSSGEEGTVTDIGWRTTRVLTTTNNIIVIPNEKITSSILTNFALPDPRAVVEVSIIAAHNADYNRIREIAIEEARKVPDALPEFTPLVFFDPGILATHMQCKLIVQVAHRLKQGPVQSELRVRLLNRFRKEGIPLPSVEQMTTFNS